MEHKELDWYDPSEDDDEQLTLFSYSDRAHREFARFDSKITSPRSIYEKPDNGSFGFKKSPRIISEQKREKLKIISETPKSKGLVFWK